MPMSEKLNLKSLLESNSGFHLTAYLENRNDLIGLRNQLRESLAAANEWLSPVMDSETKKKFLEPLENLVQDASIFKKIKGNIGLFRTEDSFRILNLPVEVEYSCQVATSFHVKPLLRWLQVDQEFLLLGLAAGSVQLYSGSMHSLKFIDSIIFPESFKEKNLLGNTLTLKELKQRRTTGDEVFGWVNDWILQVTKFEKPKLFVAGATHLVEALERTFKYDNRTKSSVANYFDESKATEICAKIRLLLSRENKLQIQKTLLEFRLAEENQLAKKNIFQISKAAAQGRVKSLIIADEINIFGKVDEKSGGLAIHPCDLDHEDDDILDDLAQLVLKMGGQVTVASRHEIPKGRPILAILNDSSKDRKSTEQKADPRQDNNLNSRAE
jgi:Bacterial archaeo-eukaryotic release factor family 3